MKRRIAVFTGTRAEYGLLRTLVKRLDADERCELSLVVSGTHLSRVHGHTVDEILADGFTPASCIDMELDGDSPSDICKATGKLIAGIGKTFESLSPDLLVLLGDRYECLAAAVGAGISGVPIAHLHGGEITEGAVDDAFRHAITKLSHLHFTSTEAYRQRVIQLGENPRHVFMVGALGVENALSIPPLDEDDIRAFLKIPAPRPYFLCTFHPVTLEHGNALAQVKRLLSSFEDFPEHAVVFTGANADSEGDSINRLLTETVSRHPGQFRFFASLGVIRYLSAARYAAAVVGNSSSGIVEVPSLKTPVVDIGERQKGRIRSPAIIHCDTETEEITTALRRALTTEQHDKARNLHNPYEKPGVSASIAETILSLPLAGILKKSFYNLPQSGE